MDLPDTFFERMLRIRGGCRCSNPNTYPPCNSCTDGLTDAEANKILSELALELPVTETLRIQTMLIESGYDGTINTEA